jgi:sphingomyelin phosphodiesterase acid-like 3
VRDKVGLSQGELMRSSFATSILRAAAKQFTLICFLMLATTTFAQRGQSAAAAHAPARPPVKVTVPALLLSDIHFDPFWDPAKVPQLVAAPASEWKAILAYAPSPDQKQRVAALQRSCPVRGADTSFALYDSSLKAMRKPAAGAKFIAISGDLLAHEIQCKYYALYPSSTLDSYRIFVDKTLEYVIGELKDNFPNVPEFIGLGNNDSACGDYRLDAHNEFLADIGKVVTRDFSSAERESALDDFSTGGYYSVTLPAPIQNARLLVLNDIFMSKNFATCSGKPDLAAANAQLEWLRKQLSDARANKQKIWVMGHIPPGINLHATVTKLEDVCGGHGPEMFLSSEKLADALTDNSDVVQLAIFGHTHMDEIKILKAEHPADDSAAPANIDQSVAVKLVSSISPINGNKPSFTVAQIDPATAVLKDYKVFSASNSTGVDALWTEEYDFAQSYHETEFSASSIRKLVAGFTADSAAKTQASQNYIQDFSLGYMSSMLQAFWPQYVCTMSTHTRESFKSCVCGSAR